MSHNAASSPNLETWLSVQRSRQDMFLAEIEAHRDGLSKLHDQADDESIAEFCSQNISFIRSMICYVLNEVDLKPLENKVEIDKKANE
jgi:hypothetical protein